MPNDSRPDCVVGRAPDTASHERRRRAGTAVLGALASDGMLMILAGRHVDGRFQGRSRGAAMTSLAGGRRAVAADHSTVRCGGLGHRRARPGRRGGR